MLKNPKMRRKRRQEVLAAARDLLWSRASWESVRISRRGAAAMSIAWNGDEFSGGTCHVAGKATRPLAQSRPLGRDRGMHHLDPTLDAPGTGSAGPRRWHTARWSTARSDSPKRVAAHRAAGELAQRADFATHQNVQRKR